MQELFEHVDAGRLTILREDYAPRPEAEQVRAIESAHGPLPPGLAAIDASVGSIDIEWEAPLAEPDGDHTKMRGAIRVPTLERMFGDWKDALWFDSSPPDALGGSPAGETRGRSSPGSICRSSRRRPRGASADPATLPA